MPKFRTKENFIEAIQFNRKNLRKCLEFCEGELDGVQNFEYGTLKGRIYGSIITTDNYIIKTNEHGLLIMNEDIFESLFVEY
jgi:hypothetical protein